MRILNPFQLSPLVALINIKTLGKREDAVIASIGCVVVNVVESNIVDEYYIRCQTELQAHRTTDKICHHFWQQQRMTNPASWQELFAPSIPRRPLKGALEDLSHFISQQFPTNSIIQLMGNNAEFDNAILTQAYEQAGLTAPIFKYENQSLATMSWLSKMIFGYDPNNILPFIGTKHHALHDAQHQAKVLLAIMDKLFMCTADHLEADIA
ncbi:3'-5' exonuclease [uncultured Shewanella sp.]|uniref:3'-5' exonuclease n=1 Tax=uncultured Shewanella sp. TaxID=173975 RepID=UPI0026355000|nr:3'-5' exonuclease [uncultured Shewanella sp.]